ncbi:unnamed protein product [Closterium sp. NIES-65]|nr:unnamed protein product [Closterium sp. NIES-65]
MRRVGLLHFHGFLNALASDPMPLHVQWVCSLHFQCFLTSLASHALPLHIQRLRCRCMFHALTFLPAVHATAQLAIQRLRSAAGVLPRVQEQWMDGEDEAGNRGAGNGENQGKKYEREKMEGQVESQVRAQVKGQVNDTSGQVQSDIGHVGPREPEPPAGIPRYVAAHIPFDAVSAAYSLCSFTARHHHNDYHNQTQDQNQHDNQYEQQGQGQERDEAEEELEEVRDIRRLLFPVLHAYEQQGRLNAPDWYRRIGRCPVAPEEAALVLAGMGVGRMRPLFLVGVSAEPCRLVLGGESVLSGGDGGMQGGREEEWREEEGWRGAAWEQEEQEGRMRAQQEQQLRGPGRRWFNGCRRLEAVRALFPFLLSIDTLLSPLEIAPYSHSPLLITALETIVASESDLFLAADGSSQLAALVAGRRMYFGSRSDKKSGYQHGYRPSVRINRAQLAEDLGGGKDLRAGEEWIGDAEERIMEWEEVEERVRAMVGESKSVRKRRVSRSVYRHPRDEACMCFGEGGKRGEEVGSEEWGGTGEERGRKKKLQGREVRGGGLGRADVGRSGDTGSGKGLDDGGRWEEKGEIRAKRRVGKDGGSNGPAKRQRLRGVVGGRGVSVGVDDDDEEDEGEDGVESGESNMDRDEEEREVERTIRLHANGFILPVLASLPSEPVRLWQQPAHPHAEGFFRRLKDEGEAASRTFLPPSPRSLRPPLPPLPSMHVRLGSMLTRVLSGGDMSSLPTVSAQVSLQRFKPPSLLHHPPPLLPPSLQSLYDLGSNLLTRVLSGGDMSGMPTASGEVSDLVGRPLFFALHNWFLESALSPPCTSPRSPLSAPCSPLSAFCSFSCPSCAAKSRLGGVYRLAFGPKAFVVISDPVVARHVLKENPFAYDKGMLAELLEPIMGKGLIPADFDTWKQRRRAIVPGFHAAYLEAMALVFSECSKRSVDKLQALCDQAGAAAGGEGVRMDMESEYSSIALDIIGISVFNYDFGSVTRESPVIKAVYGTLSEAEHRATFYIPYWNIPFISLVVPRQMKFQQDLKVINDCLDDLITRARATRQEDDLEALQQRDYSKEDDLEALQQRDYSKVRDASLLRFLVDLRGEDCDDKQLRDDLMTMLVAGHETTAAVLTWATYMLSQHPRVLAKLQEEVDAVLGDRLATLQDIKSLEYTRLVVSEALRLYPQPPLLIRRALANDHLPSGYKGNPEGYNLPKGTDLFVSHVIMSHESKHVIMSHESKHVIMSHESKHVIMSHESKHVIMSHESKHVIMSHESKHVIMSHESKHVIMSHESKHVIMSHESKHVIMSHESKHVIMSHESKHVIMSHESKHVIMSHESKHVIMSHESKHVIMSHESKHVIMSHESKHVIMSHESKHVIMSHESKHVIMSHESKHVIMSHESKHVIMSHESKHVIMSHESKHVIMSHESKHVIMSHESKHVIMSHESKHVIMSHESKHVIMSHESKHVIMSHESKHVIMSHESKHVIMSHESKHVIMSHESKHVIMSHESKHVIMSHESKHVIMSHESKHVIMSHESKHVIMSHESKHVIMSHESRASMCSTSPARRTSGSRHSAVHLTCIVCSLELRPPSTLLNINRSQHTWGTYHMVFNINRSPHYWENPEEFRPERFLERRSGDGIPGWDGYDPDRLAGALYPNENRRTLPHSPPLLPSLQVVSDFAFLPFGGGPRKCVGDQFALMESTVALAMILRRFNVRLDGPPEDTEMVMGATMHTKSGLCLGSGAASDRPQEKGVAADAAGAAANA